jgi:hypothetical protein
MSETDDTYKGESASKKYARFRLWAELATRATEDKF